MNHDLNIKCAVVLSKTEICPRKNQTCQLQTECYVLWTGSATLAIPVVRVSAFDASKQLWQIVRLIYKINTFIAERLQSVTMECICSYPSL